MLQRFRAGDRTARAHAGNLDLDPELVEHLNAVLDEAAAGGEAREDDLRYLRVISHELRSPLALIVGFCDLLLSDLDFSEAGVGAEPQDYLERVQRAGKLLDRLHDGQVLVSKVLAGVVAPSFESLALRSVVEDAVADVIAGLPGGSTPLAVTIEIAADLQVTTSPRWLLRCLEAYLTNAIEHDPSGAVVVRASPCDGGVELVVSDLGPGLNEADLEKVFEPFPRVSKTRVGDGVHLGLGLYTTRLIAERVLGGRVAVSSTENEGAHFTIFLPA
jgi:signal transduction histidine kinase